MARLVDTSVWIPIERRRLPITAVRDMAPNEPVALAAMTVSELLVGAERATTEARRWQREQFVNLLLEHFPVLPFDTEVARHHARLWAILASQGTPVGPNDLIIAATALTHGYNILTDNLREFQRIPGLTVIQPAW